MKYFKDRYLLKITRMLNDHNSAFKSGLSFMVGLLIGVYGNVLSDASVKDFGDVLERIFNVQSRSINLFNWIVLILIIFGVFMITIVPFVARKWRRELSYDDKLRDVLINLKHESLQDVYKLAVGEAVTLQKCPEIERGWLAADIKIMHSPKKISLPTIYEQDYERYTTEFIAESGKDNPTIMLSEVPWVGTDNSELTLQTNLSTYILSNFYWDNHSNTENNHKKLLAELFSDGKVTFAHNLCLQLVVVTSDKHICLTLRSNMVRTDKNTWSCSIEENFTLEDKPSHPGSIARWMQRALKEEMGLLLGSHYDNDDLKILSVFLESNRMNIALSGFVRLNIDKKQLETHLKVWPRDDDEIVKAKYMTFDEIKKQLFNPTLQYHPTSRYRMLMAILHEYGEPKFASQCGIQ